MFKDTITHEKYPGFFIIMNNRIEQLYQRIFNFVLNILTQNMIYNLKLEYIITDTESAMINAINNVFINIKRIGCYFHLKYDCLQFLKKNHFYNKEKKNISDKILNEIGLIPLKYKGDMNEFEKIIIDINKRYPEYSNFITNYFVKYKKKYFQDGTYNYSLIPKDCRTNSFLENYNNFIKHNLGKKNIVSWLNFIEFIYDDIERNEKKLYQDSNKNIRYHSKYTKFKLGKYLESNHNNYNNNSNININPFLNLNNSNKLTDINWIKYNSFSCRYDAFLTLYILTIHGYLKNKKEELNHHIKFLIEIGELFLQKNFNVVDDIWNYFIINGIDINSTKKINNITYLDNSGFHKEGYINQLFNVFNKCLFFCTELTKFKECVICKYKDNEKNELMRPLISITDEFLSLNKLESILILITPENKKDKCPFCKLPIDTLNIIYKINAFPKYLTLIFEYDHYKDLYDKKDLIIDKIEFKLKSPLNDEYELLGGITMASSDHFTCFINKIEKINSFTDIFDDNILYYHDGIKNNGYFVKYKDLFELLKCNINLVPYILLYGKINN